MNELLSKINPGQLSLAVLIAVSVGVLVYAHMRKGNTFSFYDMMLDPVTKRASLDAVVTLFLAGLSAWYVAYKAMHPAAGNVGTELTSILMIFLVYRGVHQGIQAYAAKPPPPPPASDQIGQQVIVTPDAAPAAPAGKLPSAVTTSRVTK